MQSIIEFISIFIIFMKNKILLISSTFSIREDFVVEVGNYRLNYL